tara:strand:- start:116 stop:688 length:573 start_codon:yes stop_codon:yes gene_type:complete
MNSLTKFQKHYLGVLLITVLLLLIPLVAMVFTDEVIWTLGDFVFAGIMLSVTGTSFAYVLNKNGSNQYKIGSGIALISSFLLVWVNLAVGIVGHEGEAINMLYFGVLAIGLIGAFLTRFRAQEMSYILFTMAFALMLVAVIALMGFMQEPPHNTAMQIITVNAFFAVLFSLSAISFRQAIQNSIKNKDSF